MGLGKFYGYQLPLIVGGLKEADSSHSLIVEKNKAILRPPPKYKVVMFNDDYTPMDFVVEVLELYFNMDRIQATQVMLRVHLDGKAVCGIYSRDIAETKTVQVNQYSQQNKHPLLCQVEAA